MKKVTLSKKKLYKSALWKGDPMTIYINVKFKATIRVDENIFTYKGYKNYLFTQTPMGRIRLHRG